MKKLINWTIRKLGGHTSKEFIEIKAKHDAILNAHNQTMHWFNKPILRVETKAERYNVVVAVTIEDRMPIEYIKRDLCRNLADKLFEDGLISFDVADDDMRGEKLYRGTATMLLPVGFGVRP